MGIDLYEGKSLDLPYNPWHHHNLLHGQEATI